MRRQKFQISSDLRFVFNILSSRTITRADNRDEDGKLYNYHPLLPDTGVVSLS